MNAVKGKMPCDFKKILNAVMSDFPYELYWFNKTIGYTAGYRFRYTSANGSSIKITDDSVATFYLIVDPSYAAMNANGVKEQYKTDSAKLSTIPEAVQTAKNIVSEASGKTDYEKLIFYRKSIRDLTEYNDDALASGYSKQNINPWQMIYVFDGDPATKVVCEGFSKAFQYLCDETSFSNKHICSYIVTGEMRGGTGAGPHMWNLVHIGRKGNYLADVTNAPANNVRFLSGYTSKDSNGTYTFEHPNYTGDDGANYLGGSTEYQFDDDTISTYSTEELSIAEGYGPLTEEDFNGTDDHTFETVITKEPSCTEAGEKKSVCTWCGETRTEIIPATSEHTWDEGRVTKEPSCAEGERTYTCTVCGGTKTESIAATGEHAWDEGRVTKEPSCAEGERTYTCRECRETKTESIAATGEHAWDEGVVTKEPSCAEGEKIYTCSVCGETRTESIAGTGEHAWNEGVVTKEPSCAEGEKTYTCSVCGETRTESIAGTGEHTWDEGKVTKEPSCAEGERTYTCNVCGETRTESIAATGEHAWNKGVVTKEPSCAEGEKTYTCSVCGETRTESVAATGEHAWDEGRITKEPSCAEGERTYTCSVCGETRTESIAATGEHVWGEYIVEQEPACTEAGKKKRSCTLCDQTEEEIISALGHDYKAKFNWSDDHASCTMTLACDRENCSDVKEGLDTKVTSELKKAPACISEGIRVYTATLTLDKDTYTDTKEVNTGKDLTKHTATEVRNAVTPTAYRTGYTGDVYCKACGKKISAGTVIPATGGSYGGSYGGNYGYTGPYAGPSGNHTSGNTNSGNNSQPGNSSNGGVFTETKTNDNGSTTTTEKTVDNTGRVTQTVETTIEQVSASVQKITITVNNDSGTEKKEITTEKKSDDSVVQTEILTKADNQVITTVTTMNNDGSSERNVHETITNSKGSRVTVTTTTQRDTLGNENVIKESVIMDSHNNAAATVTMTDYAAGGKNYSASVEKITGEGNQLSITGSMIGQIAEAADQNNASINFIGKDSYGKEKFTVIADTKDLFAGNSLYIYQYNVKTGEYVIVNDRIYTVSGNGDVTVSGKGRQTYQLVDSKKAGDINQAVLKTVKVKKSSFTIKKGKAKNISFSSKLNLNNVKKITYSTSQKKIAAVSASGKITARKEGTVTVKAKVTLKNGMKKTVLLKVRVKKK